ncbi:MAG: DUF4287 domain-containing protein [Caulobacterales bacterium]
MAAPHLTERQRKWFDAVRAGLERDTGKSLEEWVKIARACPETAPRARLKWMREHHGLGVNRAAQVLGEAFPTGMGWDQPEKLRAALWTDANAAKILAAVEAAVARLPDTVTGQRKGFTAWSRNVQFAALKPTKDGGAVLGLAVEPAADARLTAPKNEGWSERLTAKLPLGAAAEVDQSVTALLKSAWERS